MSILDKKSRIVVKIGSNTLTHSTGKLNLRRMETLVRTLSDFCNSGHEIILVSSGAVGQILMTKDVIDNPTRRAAAESTFRELLGYGCIPIVNENDSVSSEEIKFGGNDTLSAYVALVCSANILINLSDVDGLYNCDPRKNPDAKLISRVDVIDDSIMACAGGAGSERGTGGMITKIKAAQIATSAGIPMLIVNGKNPDVLYEISDGKHIGTYFAAKREE